MAKNDDTDDLREDVERMADRLGLQGKRRSRYIHEHMLEGGYKAVPHYVRADDDDDDDDDGGFLGNRDRSRDRSDRSRSRSRSTSRSDDWYSN